MNRGNWFSNPTPGDCFENSFEPFNSLAYGDVVVILKISHWILENGHENPIINRVHALRSIAEPNMNRICEILWAVQW